MWIDIYSIQRGILIVVAVKIGELLQLKHTNKTAQPILDQNENHIRTYFPE